MRELTISPEMQGKLEELKIAEATLSEVRRADDTIIADASNRIAAEGSSWMESMDNQHVHVETLPGNSLERA